VNAAKEWFVKSGQYKHSVAVMKGLSLIVLCLGLAFSARAIDRAELDSRLRTLTSKFEILEAKPDKRIPPQILRRAQGIILLDCTKGGLVFGYQGGHGAAMVKDPRTEQWSTPAFFKLSEASFGLQIGGQQSFVVILLMNSNVTQQLTEPMFKFGGEASGTAGNASGGTEGTVSNVEPLEMIYTDTAGLYGGAALKGASLAPDPDANLAYYGEFLTTKEILFEHKASPTPTATDLTHKISAGAK